MPAHYRSAVADFVATDPAAIVGRLTAEAARSGYYQQVHSQTQSWQEGIALLQSALSSGHELGGLSGGAVLLEFPIPRRGKRVDAILLASGAAIVMELKCGAQTYARDAVAQVEDYCLDLRDFHEPSRKHPIVPVLVATRAPQPDNPFPPVCEGVAGVLKANSETLAGVLGVATRAYGGQLAIDVDSWDNGEYSPTPTVIEAAQHLYARQDVREISRCHGGAENLTRTTDAVVRAIAEAQQTGSKLICFVTGVPGAGKTLAGLNIVHNPQLHDGDLGVFLSGNGPLVKVLTEALARDRRRREGGSMEDARRKASTFVQNVHRFIDAYYESPQAVPRDRVIIFDEAQRAWNKEQSQRKFGRPFSEPELVLSAMDRHDDWAVVVALIGFGQEINSGEAGLAEWGRVLQSQFCHWKVLISQMLLSPKAGDTNGLFAVPASNVEVRTDPSLHLDVSLRSYRAQALSDWVAAALDGEHSTARGIIDKMPDYPIVLTRDLAEARRWLRIRQRGLRRIGLLASSGAKRLRAVGLDVSNPVDVEEWFLNPDSDVRSSFSLETAATEFDVQGLELDWSCVAWGGDLSRADGSWCYRQFRGTRWQAVADETRKRYILNKYRVLLTRAREGMIVYVPLGDDSDPTRPQRVYESIAAYLTECGAVGAENAPGPRPRVEGTTCT